MAAAVLADRLRRRAIEVKVESAGLAALVGLPADPIVRELMAERRLDLSGHRARQLTAELVRSFDLVLVMERGQQAAVEAMSPIAKGRVHRLGRWGDFDVPDPYRRGRPAFEHSLSLIDRGLDAFERACWP